MCNCVCGHNSFWELKMHLIDIVLGIVVLLFFIIGYVKGFIKGLVQVLGLILTLYLVKNGGHIVKAELIERFSLSSTIAMVLSYIAIILIIGIIAKLVIWILHSVADLLHMKVLNRILGGAFGILNSILIMIMFLVLIELSPLAEQFYERTKESKVIVQLKVVKDTAKLKIPKNKLIPQKINEELKKKLTDGVSKSKEAMEEFLEEQEINK